MPMNGWIPMDMDASCRKATCRTFDLAVPPELVRMESHNEGKIMIKINFTFLIGIILVGLIAGMGTANSLAFSEDTQVTVALTLPDQAMATLNPDDPVFLPSDLQLAGEQFWNVRTHSYMTDRQIRIMLLAYEVGDRFGGYGEVLQAIVLQESIASLLPLVADMSKPPMGRSYGVAMVKPIAAAGVFRFHPELDRGLEGDALVQALRYDHEYNLQIAVRYLDWLVGRTDSLEEALVAYNLGYAGSRHLENYAEYRYTQGVLANWNKVVTPFNQQIRPIGYRPQIVASAQ